MGLQKGYREGLQKRLRQSFPNGLPMKQALFDLRTVVYRAGDLEDDALVYCGHTLRA